jgi:hypothetical protein
VSEIESTTAVADEAQPASAERSNSSMNLDTRPDIAWLSEVEGEVDDVDRVLKCLARESDTICQTCKAAEHDGILEQRPVLARCASTKQR